MNARLAMRVRRNQARCALNDADPRYVMTRAERWKYRAYGLLLAVLLTCGDAIANAVAGWLQ